jgi:hypothetical protein
MIDNLIAKSKTKMKRTDTKFKYPLLLTLILRVKIV